MFYFPPSWFIPQSCAITDTRAHYKSLVLWFCFFYLLWLFDGQVFWLHWIIVAAFLFGEVMITIVYFLDTYVGTYWYFSLEVFSCQSKSSSSFFRLFNVDISFWRLNCESPSVLHSGWCVKKIEHDLTWYTIEVYNWRLVNVRLTDVFNLSVSSFDLFYNLF